MALSLKYLCVLVLAVWLGLFLALQEAQAADPDPLQDFCVADTAASITVNGYPCKPAEKLTTEDFFFDGLIKEKIVDPNLSPLKSTITFGLAKHWPALNTQGLSLVRLDLAPGGVVVPHTHALATEVIHVLEGEIYTGFITNDNQLYAKTVRKGESFIFPRALQHFQLNVGKGHAVSVNFLNSQNPGIQFSTSSLFKSGILPAVLAKSFNISDQEVADLSAKITIPKGP